MGFAKFMASAAGRILRGIAGLVMIYAGFFIMDGTVGAILATTGFVPLLAGVFDFCIFAPLFGAPFSGKAIRKS
jgi:uncharacterized membrane protein